MFLLESEVELDLREGTSPLWGCEVEGEGLVREPLGEGLCREDRGEEEVRPAKGPVVGRRRLLPPSIFFI